MKPKINKTIQLKAQKRYENPVYKKLKKYEYYVTTDYVDSNLDYDSVISVKTNGKFFDPEHRRVGIIVDVLAKHCGVVAQYVSIGDETVLGVATDGDSPELYPIEPLYGLNKKQQELSIFLQREERKNLCFGCLLIEKLAKLIDARASVKVRVCNEEYLYGRFAVDIIDFDSKIKPDIELDKPANNIPMKIEKKVDDFVDLIFSQGNVKRANTEALKLKQEILAYGFDLIWHFPDEKETTQTAKRKNFYDIEGQPKQTFKLGEYGEIALKEIDSSSHVPHINGDNEIIQSEEPPFMRKSGNALSVMGIDYHRWLSAHIEGYIEDNPYDLLSELDNLSLDESQLNSLTPTKPYHVGTFYPKMGGMGDHTRFRLYWESETNEEALLRYIRVEMSEHGAWQLYLLKTTPCVMPTYWHGNYMKRKFIFEEYDLYGIDALNDYDLTDIITCPIIWPSVSLEHQTEDSVVAHVFCCYWNDWKGLIREHVKMTLKNGRVEKYENIDDFVIYKYHCGIFL